MTHPSSTAGRGELRTALGRVRLHPALAGRLATSTRHFSRRTRGVEREPSHSNGASESNEPQSPRHATEQPVASGEIAGLPNCAGHLALPAHEPVHWPRPTPRPHGNVPLAFTPEGSC